MIGLSASALPWLLKNPSDILAPDALVAAFPDACIVCTHRYPVAAIPSVASLLVALRRGTQRYGTDSGVIDPKAIGRRELEWWRTGLARYEAAKRRQPERFHDVWQRELIADPLQVLWGIYERFGLELSPDAEDRMQKWAASTARRGQGAHRYAPEHFGLTADEIHEHYADYRAAYGFE